MSDLKAALSTYLAGAARNNSLPPSDDDSQSLTAAAAAAGTALPIPPASVNMNVTAPLSTSSSSSSSSSSGGPSAESVIFDYGEIAVLATFYGITFVLGLLSNIAMLYVILGEELRRHCFTFGESERRQVLSPLSKSEEIF